MLKRLANCRKAMMNRKRLKFVRSFCLLVFAAAVAHPAIWAQAAADVALSTGSPTTIFHGTDLETVDTNSGNLKVSIPLVHLPGRGIDLDIRLTYNSKIWTSEYTPSASPGSPALVNVVGPYGFASGAQQDLPFQSPKSPGWSVGQVRMGFTTSGYDECVQTAPLDPSTCTYTVSHSSWVDTEGTITQLVDNNFSLPSGELASFDGSFDYLTSRGLIYKDGVIAEPGNIAGVHVLKDTNGNEISCAISAQLQWTNCTDTLGRKVTFTNDPVSDQLDSLGYTDSSGISRSISFHYSSFVLEYAFGAVGQCTESAPAPVSKTLLTSVTLANGLSYQFQYLTNADGSTTGEISKIILPTGGYFRYTYDFAPISNDAGLNSCGDIHYIAQDRIVTNRFVSPDGTAASEQPWNYSVTTPSQLVDGRASIATAVRDPLGNTQTYFRDISGWPLVHHIDYADASGTILRSVANTIEEGTGTGTASDPYFYVNAFSNPRVKSSTTILRDTNQQSQTTFIYGNYNNVSEKDETDWGSGTPGLVIRKTTISYWHDTNPAYAGDAVHILNRVNVEQVCDAGSTFCSQTTTKYDETPPTSTATSPVIQHDYTNYSSSNSLRGNPTSISRLLNTTGGNVVTTNQYNDVGNLIQTTDANLNVTSFSYADDCAPRWCREETACRSGQLDAA